MISLRSKAIFAPQKYEAVEVLWICLTFILFLTEAIDSSSASNPGLKIRVSRAGLDYAANVGVRVLSERAKRVQISDLKDSAEVSIGRVEYEITNIKVRLGIYRTDIRYISR